ncbi:MAG TPA: hypothetical protein ENN36_06720 [Candidatus Bathyarchaeota archaeon]|nr:hypothetical protein [Candidatus Bathyarchaeota archaeon]
MSKRFFSKYQSYSGNSLYVELSSMLDKINADKNLTETSVNLKLEVTNAGDDTSFKWTYISNGIEAPSKFVALGYKNGFLNYFVDSWDIYKIGGTSVNLSEEEARDLAMERVKTYSWKVKSNNNTVKINNFNVTKAMVMNTIFCNSLNVDEARGEDPLRLYPMRHVWVSLDKFYPGNVYGIEVYIWADTKEIVYVKERYSTMDPPTDLIANINESVVDAPDDQTAVSEAEPNSMPIELIALPAIVAVLLGNTLVWLMRMKPSRFHCLSKLTSSKIIGVLFCFLITLMALSTPISVVLADSYYGHVTFWGSESTGAWLDSEGFSGRKHPDEVTQQQNTAHDIASIFSSRDYSVDNYQGDDSVKQWILANISDNEQNYPRVAVVYFDHGVGRNDTPAGAGEWHFMVEDNVGLIDHDQDPKTEPIADHDHLVYDYEIYSKTGLGNTFFAFINTCYSAALEIPEYEGVPAGTGEYGENPNGYEVIGMPYAWTHEASINEYGYADPDPNCKFCYIGFPRGAASLNQTFHEDYPYTKYAYWVENFFSWAINYDLTVNEALNQTSLMFGGPFGSHVLHTGFTAIWPMYLYNETTGEYEWMYLHGGENQDTLVVYGNGNIKLYQPLLTVNAYDSSGNPLEVDVKIDDESVGTTAVSKRVFATFPDETHKIEVTEPDGYTFQNFTVGVNTYTYKPIDIPVESDLTVTAYFTQEPFPNQVTVIIDSVPHDGYSRYHALTVDNPIPQRFWEGDWHNQNPDAIIAVTGSTLHYETTFYLTEGYHNIEYAVSCWVGYWHATITVNSQVVAEQDTDVYNHVTAQINVGGSPPPPQYRLSISAGAGGTTNPQPGDHWYPAGTPVQVTANPYGGYNFDRWLLDGNPYYQNPITVTMNNHHTLQAIFIQGTCDISTGSVYLHNGQYYQCEVPFYIDGQEVGPTWSTYQVSPGYHTFAVPQVAWGGLGFAVVFQYWVVNGWPGPSSNPIGGTVTQDMFFGAVYEVILW